MAATHSETAEQKLLKMIETSSDEASSPKKKKALGKRVGSAGFLKVINRLLIVGVIVSAYFLFQEVQSGGAFMNQEVEFPKIDVASGVQGREAMIPPTQELNFYTASLDRRNLFEPYERKTQNVVEVSNLNKTISNKISHLKLVGISWTDSVDSASVMLEDTNQDTTYFLQKDEKLGEINVKTIYADSVELGFQDEEIMVHYDTLQR